MPKTYRAYSADGNVILEGAVDVAGLAEFDADTSVNRVVFYTGTGDDEAVAGCVDVGKSGSISVGLPES